MAHYALSMPSSQDVRERFNHCIEEWKDRNAHIDKVREYLEGRNSISAPQTTQYQVIVQRTHMLEAIVSEKAARFTLQPKIQVVSGGPSPRARNRSSELEEWLNATFYWMEVYGDGDVWARMVMDAIPFDVAFERIECAPAPFWPEIVSLDDNGREQLYNRYEMEKLKKGQEFAHPYEDTEAYQKYRDAYKMSAGAPIRSIYVPPDCAYPIYEGATAVEVYEREQRSLRSVLNSPLFEGSDGVGALRGVSARLSEREQLKQEVVIVHSVNQMYHSYWALTPTTSRDLMPKGKQQADIGKPELLYSYCHGLGRVLYNIMGGRNGGWKGRNNSIEPVMRSLYDLNQALDNLASQVATNTGATNWPTIVQELDPAYRDPTGGPPKAIQIAPGQSIPIWKGEKLYPLMTPASNPIVQWQYGNLVQQMERLSGSSAIYGQQDPGVRTGYHANLQISQSEHLDEKLEQHLVAAAIQRAHIVLGHVKAMGGETVFAHHRFTDRSGIRRGKYVKVDPKELDPLPEIDASVRRPRPIDYDAAIRSAIAATQDRAGPGTPLLDDDTVRERILGEDAPDTIETKVAIQNEKRKLTSGGVLSQKIGERIGLLLAKSMQPSITGEQAAQADPALLAAIGGLTQAGVPAAQGGVDPRTQLAIMQGEVQQGITQGAPPALPPTGPPAPSALQGTGGGPAAGRPQPEQVVAKALQSAAASRR